MPKNIPGPSNTQTLEYMHHNHTPSGLVYSYFVLDEYALPKFTSFPKQNYHILPNKMVVNGCCGYLRPINQSEIDFIFRQTDSLSRYLLRSLWSTHPRLVWIRISPLRILRLNLHPSKRVIKNMLRIFQAYFREKAMNTEAGTKKTPFL